MKKHVGIVKCEGSPTVIVNLNPERETLFLEKEINNCKPNELVKLLYTVEMVVLVLFVVVVVVVGDVTQECGRRVVTSKCRRMEKYASTRN